MCSPNRMPKKTTDERIGSGSSAAFCEKRRHKVVGRSSKSHARVCRASRSRLRSSGGFADAWPYVLIRSPNGRKKRPIHSSCPVRADSYSTSPNVRYGTKAPPRLRCAIYCLAFRDANLSSGHDHRSRVRSRHNNGTTLPNGNHRRLDRNANSRSDCGTNDCTPNHSSTDFRNCSGCSRHNCRRTKRADSHRRHRRNAQTSTGRRPSRNALSCSAPKRH